MLTFPAFVDRQSERCKRREGLSESLMLLHVQAESLEDTIFSSSGRIPVCTQLSG